jgi:hypothetical protein
MTIQRITNLPSAPISACLRAFVLAAETGISLNSRPNVCRHPSASNSGNTLGKEMAYMANIFKGGNVYVTGFVQGNSALLRGSA